MALIARAWRRLALLVATVLPHGARGRLWAATASRFKRWPKAERRVEGLRRRLLTLGLSERAVVDLERMVADASKPYQRGLAARVLACWYANQRDPEGARRALELLPIATRNELSPSRLRQAAILEADCRVILGQPLAARRAIQHRLAVAPDAELLLAAASLELEVADRVPWINRALAHHGLAPISFDVTARGPAFDGLRCDLGARMPSVVVPEGPKVTVIMPAFDAAATIGTALASVLAQSWRDLEVLVVDDASTDATVAVAEEHARRDPRVRVLRSPVNRGTFVARNLGLADATGELVTCHDADDWSHPERIERQVRHLMANPEVVGNTCQLARTTEDLRFSRGNNPGKLLLNLPGSFLFRRKEVLESVGYWDSVRFGADTELLRRLRLVLGQGAIVDLATGPLVFYRKSGRSLTGHPRFGHPGYPMGAAHEYTVSQRCFHAAADPGSLRYGFPQARRPFPAPEPYRPVREVTPTGRRRFDVLIGSDFRMFGGSTLSSVEEIKVQRRLGLRTGLIQMPHYPLDPARDLQPEVRRLLDGEQVELLVYGERVECDLLILRYPPILQERQRRLPEVEARQVRVIVNQTPRSHYGSDGVVRYDIPRCARHLEESFGPGALWHPIGPSCRRALHQHHAADLVSITLADQDWLNIIDVDEWRRASRPPASRRVRIGRHARDHPVKWPADAGELLSVYPDGEGYEVHILGGGRTPRGILGRLPERWRVHELGAMHPRDFLASLDVFVYFTHREWVESFGRVILEAMATGVPVILPASYRDLFGEAAIYAQPSEVAAAIDRLMGDSGLYDAQVERARFYVEHRFGYARHASRLEVLLGRPFGAPRQAVDTLETG